MENCIKMINANNCKICKKDFDFLVKPSNSVKGIYVETLKTY